MYKRASKLMSFTKKANISFVDVTQHPHLNVLNVHTLYCWHKHLTERRFILNTSKTWANHQDSRSQLLKPFVYAVCVNVFRVTSKLNSEVVQ